MSLSCTVLGAPGKDNALLVTVDTGQSVHRLLFDCGDGCLTVLPIADILAIDHLFLSHLHMDHIAGFDTFFRCTFDRSSRPNRAWGPPGTARILQHRFQGFLWNLHEQMQGTWRVTDIGPEWLCTARFELGEAFAAFHDDCMEERSTVVLDHPQFTVEAIAMEHRTTTLAYIVREKPRRNIDVTRLGALGLQPGPWLKQLKEAIDPESAIVVDGVAHTAGALAESLVSETPGDSVAYLTDFLLDDQAMDALVPRLRECNTVVCEAQYRHADLDLAHRHFHMTTVLSATLAQRAAVRELVLFHLSERYSRSEWLDMLSEARAVFPRTRFADSWRLDAD